MTDSLHYLSHLDLLISVKSQILGITVNGDML